MSLRSNAHQVVAAKQKFVSEQIKQNSEPTAAQLSAFVAGIGAQLEKHCQQDAQVRGAVTSALANSETLNSKEQINSMLTQLQRELALLSLEEIGELQATVRRFQIDFDCAMDDLESGELSAKQEKARQKTMEKSEAALRVAKERLKRLSALRDEHVDAAVVREFEQKLDLSKQKDVVAKAAMQKPRGNVKSSSSKSDGKPAVSSAAIPDNEKETVILQVKNLRVGNVVVIKDHLCEITAISMCKTGKHGHSKTNLIMKNLETGKKCEETMQTSKTIESPGKKWLSYFKQ